MKNDNILPWKHISGFDSRAPVLKLPSGNIFCFMRTGGSGLPLTPLYMSRFTDQGKTWIKPEPIADRGVFPNVCRNESGIIAVACGRPFQRLDFSVDDGKTWEGHNCFYNPSGSLQFYNYVAAVGNDKFLAVYQRPGAPNSKTEAIEKEIVGIFSRLRDADAA